MSATREQTQAWPFLVGRGLHEGYRTLLAPEFLVASDLQEQLAESTPSVKVGEVGRVELEYAGVGRLDVLYTTEDLSDGDRSESDGTTWTDEHGRPLEMLYGVVARDHLSDTIGVREIRRAREEALKAYRDFLSHEAEFTLGTSVPFALPKRAAPTRYAPAPTRRPPAPAPLASPVDAKRRLAEEPVPTPSRAGDPSRRPRSSVLMRSAALLAVIAVGAVAAALLLSGGATGTVRILKLSATPVASVSCATAGQVKLQATLAGDAGTKVAYRWQAATRRAFSVETVTLTAKPRVIMDVRTSSAAPYRLVVDEPVHRQTTPVACHAASGAG